MVLEIDIIVMNVLEK